MTIVERPSPNRSPRKPGTPISAIVLHDTGGKNAEGALSWFAAPASGVSAHYVVGKDGAVYRCVADAEKAWHAGISTLWGVPDVNAYSLGVELVDDNDGDRYPDAQVEALIELLTDLCWTHRIPLHRVVGHQHIAIPPGRKVDPGDDLDWFLLLIAVGARLGARVAP